MYLDQTAKNTPDLQQVSLTDLVLEAISRCGDTADHRRVRISNSSFYTFPPMLLDPLQIIEAVRALVASAVDSAREESTVDLMLAGDEGLAELVINWRNEPVPVGRPPAAAVGAIEAHNGSVALTAGEGNLSLTVNLPVLRPAVQLDGLDSALHQRDEESHLHILLAEDSQMNRKLTAALLEKKGHSVTRVASGHEAVNAYMRGHFDLVLMDLQMPGMDGFDTAETIRRLDSGRGQRVPIVALTACDIEVNLQRCLDAGMDLMLNKPFKGDEFDLLMKQLRRAASPAHRK